MAIHKHISAHCPRCDKDVGFEIVMRFIDYNGITPCLRCPSCNVECPEYTFNYFIGTGKIVIAV